MIGNVSTFWTSWASTNRSVQRSRLDFLGEYQSFRTAFQGVSNEDQTARIVDLGVVIETVEQLGEECFDE